MKNGFLVQISHHIFFEHLIQFLRILMVTLGKWSLIQKSCVHKFFTFKISKSNKSNDKSTYIIPNVSG